MKKILLSYALIIISVSLSAVPARPGFRECTLQDGSSVLLQLSGDECYHFWETKDGKIAEEQSDGTFVITNENVPDAETMTARRRAGKRYVNRAKKIGAQTMPARVLFILVNFSDKSFSEASANYYHTSLGDNTEGAKSMHNYLKLQSNGQYAPPIDVFGPVTMPNKCSYYGSNDSQGNDQHPAEMVIEACKALDDEVDFSQYDTNNDGLVDNVYIIYAGKGEADGGATTTIWPHQWDTYSAERLYVQLDGVHVLSYACSSELNGRDIYAMGTPLHEYSHVIGLPDYYDTDYGTNHTTGRTPGDWSLMDGGSYNDNGKTPPNYSIYDKYYLGWLTPEVLAVDEHLDITLTTAHSDGYQINGGSALLPATDPNTIYYIENRQRTGWDAALPGHGMLIWQIQYDSRAWEGNYLNNTAGSPRVTILSATGNPRGIGKSSDPFPGVNGVKTCTLFAGCELMEISENNSVISFKYNGGVQRSEYGYATVGEHCTMPMDGVVTAFDALSLIITPDDGYSLDDAACWTVSMGQNKVLQYGKDFTYDAETNEFRIERVKDDVTILAQAKKLLSLKWMINGEEYTKTLTMGEVVIPAEKPVACDDGKVFVGWCKTADYQNETEAPVYINDGEEVKDDDVYHAVFATPASGPEQSVTYTFTTKTWWDASKSWKSTKDGFNFHSGKGVLVSSGYSGAGATTISSLDYVSKVVVTYCTNASAGAGNIVVKVGDTEISQDVTKEGGTQLRSIEYVFDAVSGHATVTVNCSANSIYVHSVDITSASCVLYSDYSTICAMDAHSAINNTMTEQPMATKVIRDGEVLIIRGDAVYTVLGVQK